MHLFLKNAKKNYLFCFFIAVFFIPTSKAESLSTVEIIQHTLAAAPHCLHYRVIGICFWLNCKHGVCTTETTLKIEQDLPDVVVSVYRKTNDNPWKYAKTLDHAAHPIGNAALKKMLGHLIVTRIV